MARLMVFDSEPRNTRELVSALRRQHHSVTVVPMAPVEATSIDREFDQFHVVILDLSLDRPEDWETLD
jgi:CheY-like chemotaxis protein